MKRVWTAFAGLAALLALTATVACGDDGTASDASHFGESGGTTASTDRLTSKSGTSPSVAQSAQRAPNASGASAPATIPDSSGDKGGTDGSASSIGDLDRKIVFNASLALGAGDVTAAYSEASSIASRLGGFIEKSQFSGAKEADRDNRSAALTMRVPVDKYQEALQAIRGMNNVKINNENSHSTEVTEQYTDLQSRQRTLQATEQQYLKLLEQAKTINEILTVNDRLTSVRTQIEQIVGRLKVLDHQADLATIDLSLAPLPLPGNTPNSSNGPKSVTESFADAWAGSLEAARYLASAGAVVAVVAIWFALPIGLALLGFRTLTRRARQNVRPTTSTLPPPPTAVA